MFNATLMLANSLGILRSSTATGGSATTIVDTSRTETDDAFNPAGTAWIIKDVGGASAAPEGEWARVSDWVLSTHTATISTVTAAVGAGDTYGIATGDFPLDVLINAINKEIVKYKQPLWDLTSLDITNAQTEYDLPSGIRKDNLIGVFESTVDDANNGKWVELNWYVRASATSVVHVLVVDSSNVGVGNDIGLRYMSPLVPLYEHDDVIDDIVPMARILDTAAANARAIRMNTYSSGSKLGIELMRMSREDAVLARAENPVRYPRKRGNVNESDIPSREARLEPVPLP